MSNVLRRCAALGTVFLGVFLLPQAQAAPPLSVTEFEAYLSDLRAKLASPAFSASTCKKHLDDESKYLYESTFQQIARPNDFAVKARNREDLLSRLFEIRLLARERFREFFARQSFGNADDLEACALSLKVFSRVLRGWEDVWGLQYLYQTGELERLRSIAASRAPGSEDRTLLRAPWPSTLVNLSHQGNFSFPDFLQTGDVLLSRGNTFTGAVISRIGTVDNQFSHVALVYRADGSLQGKDFLGNPLQTGKVYVIEAELNFGVRMVPIEFYASDGKLRTVVFRYRQLDPNCPHAAEKIRKFAGDKMAERQLAKHIDYNFGMTIPIDTVGEEKELFCSQEISSAYEFAFRSLGCGSAMPAKYLKPNRLSIPVVYTPFNPQANALIRKLGLTVDETFSPADIEIDPRFELVAEWRDYANISTARHYDITLTQVFDWMERANYHFADSEEMKALANFARVMASAAEKMPENTPSGYVEGTMLLYVLVELNGAKLNLLSLMGGAVLEEKMREYRAHLAEKGLSEAEIQRAERFVRQQLNVLNQRRGLSYLTGLLESLNFTQAPPGETEPRRLFFTDRQLEVGLEVQRASDCQTFARNLSRGENENRDSVLFHDFLRADFTPGSANPCPAAVQRW